MIGVNVILNTNARLDELLRARNTNIFQFSKDSGIPYSTLANPRYRKTQLSVDTIELVCKALCISLSEFFADDNRCVGSRE